MFKDVTIAMKSTRSPILPLALCSLLALPASAQAASFDCGKASSQVEHLICTDAELGSLDETLGELYRRALGDAGGAAEALRAHQRDWLAERNGCDTTECLADAYRERVAALRIRVDGPLGPIKERELPGGEVEILQQGPLVELKAKYPRLEGEDVATTKANRQIATWVRQQLQDFRQDYLSFLDGNQGDHLGPPWAIEIDAAHSYAGERFWTLDFTTYSYTGGAHGAFIHQAQVFSRDQGEPISPAGLFRPGSAWLARLAELSYARLSQREPFDSDADHDWLRTGTAPEPDNYQVLLPLADGLMVIFGQYQIGPYAIGIFDVLLGYDELAGVLNPKWFGD
ncbi:uncharacterized protein conserved in bacteria, putative lipoprotein [Thiorhodovibrio frisius]|uniref:Uncharacterized protein conserved in bacteria, putative lipoprotein n=2 Tax=Thiorhodovibrio frisius TaxID=631362 RepID=H8Z138_9GAMM|nr:uncharacterized protein conserved in bacteria, putative lipoprotein [Thiorhodovibrio frisius]WPL24760.1 hypothetical protein Thiofri_04984 [Thiorhodovibrio frisius]